MPVKGTRSHWLWPLALTAVGVVLLLRNFLLLGDFNVDGLWPLALVALGAAILLRGDVTPNNEARTFGITRGSVESATLEISAGEIDVQVRGLQLEGRLIAGQFALASRPTMRLEDTHAYLKLERSATPWLSFADWQMGIASDLPWNILVSTHLGQVSLDLSGLIIQGASIATGIGDTRLIIPQEAFSPLNLRSSLGNITIITPIGSRAVITVRPGRLVRVHADPYRYEQSETDTFVSRDPDEAARLIEVHVQGTFGDIYLA